MKFKLVQIPAQLCWWMKDHFEIIAYTAFCLLACAIAFACIETSRVPDRTHKCADIRFEKYETARIICSDTVPPEHVVDCINRGIKSFIYVECAL